MNWSEFIFSDNRSHRMQRHLAFWLAWWLYFSVSYFHYQQTGLQKVEFEEWSIPFFIKTLLLLSIHIAACYCFIQYLLPRFLLKARYFELVTGTLVLGVFILLASSFLHQVVFPLINSTFRYHEALVSQNIWWTSISAGLLSAPKVIAAASAIKLLKRWYLKQKEKERVEKEKLMADLQLLKAQVRPGFLFNSLDSIHHYSLNNTSRAAALLLKLSDLLSYTLYESDHVLVPLEKEIKIIRDYMAIEKTRMGSRLEMDIAIKGDTEDKMIAPLLLLPFIENSFTNCTNENLEKNWINLELRIENKTLAMKLIVGKPDEAMPIEAEGEDLANVQKRLEILYPGRYEFRRIIEAEMMMTHLKILLDESRPNGKNILHPNDAKSYATI
jgi:sensor histidine kinase YesM